MTGTDGWISVAERVPEGQGRTAVLALRANEVDEDLRLVVADADDVCANPGGFTHWMAIPSLPG